LSSTDNRRIRDSRPSKETVDPERPLGVSLERERLPGGGSSLWLTVFLAGAECPFTCVFCDLWRHTLDSPTPEGALTRQLEEALASRGAEEASGVKLYNASNFFDSRAVPVADLRRIARRVERFERVTVECHPRLIGDACFDFADRISGRLQVAMGLETIHTGSLARLNKGMDLNDFARATQSLVSRGIGVRAFVLLGGLFYGGSEAVEWALRSAEWALERGVEVVSIIPLRGGEGEMERLADRGDFEPPRLEQLEEVLERADREPPGLVLADLWDAERLIRCRECGPQRIERLRRINLTGRIEPPARCGRCGRPAGPAPPAARQEIESA
jgi:radical SAM enzyme (TIGR01210 family)